MTKYESVINAISKMMINREYSKARHHIKRIWNHMNEMTNTEQDVLREIALIAFNK